MVAMFKNWMQRYFSDPQAMLLLLILMGGVFLLMWMGEILAPVIASIVIAYILQWLANILIAWHVSRRVAVGLVYAAFLGLFLCSVLILWPIIWQQFLRFYADFPTLLNHIQHFLDLLPEKFPEFLTKDTVDGWTKSVLSQLRASGKTLFTASLATLPSVIAMVVYMILVPMMVFFLLIDNQQICQWIARFLPNQRTLLAKVWVDMDVQIGNYIRGKVVEVLINGISAFVVFYVLKINYAVLLAVLVGLSVLVPYIGAVVVTIPVVAIAFLQWGLSSHFAYLLLAYTVIMTLDAVVLVPLLFSEVVNLHPIAIIIAILVFGGWWGFWGVFFAIPLASLVNTVIVAWPRQAQSELAS